MSSSAWLDARALERPARVRIFAFPFAGGGTAAYRPWSAALPADIAVCPVRLPGREARLAEPPLEDLVAIARAAGDALRPHLGVPFALFGHSMGALIAFELARHLQATGGPAPRILYASCSPAPDVGEPDRVSGLSDPAFIEHLRALGGTPPEVLASAELLELLLPAMRADFTASERYAFVPGPLLDCRLIAVGGAADPQVPRHELDAWRAHTRGPFELRVMPGGHFDLLDRPAALLAQLAADLRADAR